MQNYAIYYDEMHESMNMNKSINEWIHKTEVMDI